jgi:HAMP domain-containing protein
MADDLKIPVSAPGAAKATSDLRGVAEAEKRVGDAGQAAGQKLTGMGTGVEGARNRLERMEREITDLLWTQQRWGQLTDQQRQRLELLSRTSERLRGRLDGVKRETGAVSGATDMLKASVMSMVGSYAGIEGVRRLMSLLREETEKTRQTTDDVVESLRAVLALSALKGERAEVQEAIGQMAVEAGRPIEEVATGYYTLLGGTAGMDREKQQALMGEVLLAAKTDPSAQIDSLVNLFTTIASQQPQLTPNQIGNLVSRTIEQAKSTPEEMAQYLPDVLSAAQAGDVPIEQALAAFSFSTRKGGGVAKSGQAVKSTLLGLLSPSPETAGALDQYGFPSDGDLTARMAWLADRGSSLPPDLQAAMGGRRGIQFVASISKARGEFSREQGIISSAIGADGSLVRDKLREMYGEIPSQRYLDQLRQVQTIAQREYVSDESLVDEAVIQMLDALSKRRGDSPVGRKWREFNARFNTWFGKSPENAEMSVAEQALAGLLREGYAPKELLETAEPMIQDELYDTRGPFPQRGQAIELLKDRLRRQLGERGVEPLQGASPAPGDQQSSAVYNGGYHVHNHREPDGAGRPWEARGVYS